MSQPRIKADISKFVKIIKPFATAGNTAFAIRGTGNLNDLRLHVGLISVGASTNWSMRQRRLLASASQAAGAARAATAAWQWSVSRCIVTAHILWIGTEHSSLGDLSGFSSREGFINNKINFKVIRPSGEIVHATVEENPDLWVALRGSSNNFGVVTRFSMTAFKQGSF